MGVALFVGQIRKNGPDHQKMQNRINRSGYGNRIQSGSLCTSVFVLCRGPDAVTRKMAVEFVKGEEEHCAWVAKHLAVIEKLGYDNYLLEMMDI